MAIDRRRGLVVRCFVLAGGAFVSTLLVSAMLFNVFSALASDSSLGSVVIGAVAADFAQQQRGVVLNGLILVVIGTLLGQRPAAVALRRLPGDLWSRRPRTMTDVGLLVGDNPPLARAFVWAGGLFAVLVWSSPSWRVLLTIIGLTAAADAFVWLTTSAGGRAERWRTAVNMNAVDMNAVNVNAVVAGETVGAEDTRSSGHIRTNTLVLAWIALLFWPSWNRNTIAGFFVVVAAILALIDAPKAWRMARSNDTAETNDTEMSVAGTPAPVPDRPRYLTAGLVALAAIGVGIAVTTSSVESAETSEGCNGSVDLCDRRIDEVVFAGSHNAMSSSDLGWDLALQTGDMVAQLDHGLRALLIDALYWDSGQLARTHVHRTGTPFPTLRELIDADERLLVYAENAGEPDTWLQNGYADTFGETPFTFALRSQFSCASNRGNADNPLLLINHWLTTGIPIREAASAVNSRAVLLQRVRDCEAERGRLPTIDATDFVQTGDLIEVVAELNGITDQEERSVRNSERSWLGGAR